MKAKIFQRGWNFSQDGPGNRLIYHFQGCNLRCPWCSNPEGLSVAGTRMADKKGARLSCKDCSLKEIVRESAEARPLYHTGGGVTLSGGEPTLQFDFIEPFLKELRKKNINTALETNATHPELPRLFPFIDTLILDLKHYDDAKCRKMAGAGNKTMVRNLNRAAEAHPRLWLRITLVPGFNADPADIEHFLNLIKPLNSTRLSLELLSYHEYGRPKWEQCGMPYRMKAGKITARRKNKYEDLFIKAGINVIRT